MIKMIVLKLGGSILQGDISAFLEDLGSLPEEGFILVHGGSDVMDEVAARMGEPQKFIRSPSGFRSRYTDKRTIEIFQMVVAGRVNKDLVARLQSHGVNALGLSGMDGSLITAKRKTKIKSIEDSVVKTITGDYSGIIRRVNAKLLKDLLSMGYVPVVAPLAMGYEHEPLNIDGDRLAASIAGAVGAEKLIFFTDVPGYLSQGELVAQIKGALIEETMKKAEGGMKKKLLAAKEALELGVREAVIASILREKPVTHALEHLDCTVISLD